MHNLKNTHYTNLLTINLFFVQKIKQKYKKDTRYIMNFGKQANN